jgi:hypothetical protein
VLLRRDTPKLDAKYKGILTSAQLTDLRARPRRDGRS